MAVALRDGCFVRQVNAIAYSPGGAVIATGGGDAKVKLWSPASGFCFVTFDQHTAPVAAIAFVPHGRAVVSASLDGTVRAFDLLRYRNFQTLVTPSPAQFTSVAVDPSGEIVAAGSRDTLTVFVWNLQASASGQPVVGSTLYRRRSRAYPPTRSHRHHNHSTTHTVTTNPHTRTHTAQTAQLLEELSGHEAPISSLAFGTDAGGVGAYLASGSWDRTVRLWDFVSSSSSIDVLQHNADVLDLAFQPGGARLAVATLDGQITLWDAKEAQQCGNIDGRADVAGGRSALSRVGKANRTHAFRSLSFSPDGAALLAGGHSKFVCMYDVAEHLLLRKCAPALPPSRPRSRPPP